MNTSTSSAVPWAAVALALAACTACASTPAPEPAAAPAMAPEAPAPAPPPPPPPRPLDMANNCTHEVHLYYGADPADGKGDRVTVRPGAVLPVPRDPQGNVVVWVVDEKGLGLASVHVTNHMRHVHMDGACGKIDAD